MNKKIIILIIILLIICVLLGGFIAYMSITNEANVLTEGNIKDVVATINGQAITQLDVNYQKYLNNTKNPTDETAKNDAIRNEVLFQEAKKNNIDITEEEKQKIKDETTSSMTSKDKQTAKKLKMSEQEYLDYIIEKQIENSVVTKALVDISSKISKQEINDVNDEEFNRIYEEYKSGSSSEDANQKANNKFELLEKATEAYINYLVKSYTEQ